MTVLMRWTRLLVIALCVGVVSPVAGCTLDFGSLGAGGGVGPSPAVDRFSWGEPPSWGEPWDTDGLSGRGRRPWGYRRYGSEP